MFFLKKSNFILFFSLLAIVATASLLFIINSSPTDTAQAGSEHNVGGWAWADATGWVSFNCTNKACRNVGWQGQFCSTDADCGGQAASCLNDCTITGKNYGVNLDLNTGIFSGYAYSANSGWVSFQETPPETTWRASCQNPGACTGACSACFNNSTGKVYGWANIINLGDNGWIKLSDDSNPLWADKGVKIASDGAFSGWAWHNNDAGSGTGWLSFNCADAGAGGCSGHDYHVQGNIIGQPQAVSVTQALDNKCSGLKVQWDVPVWGAAGFQIIRDGTQITTGAGTCKEWPLAGGVCTDLGLSPGATYQYVVRACNDASCALYSDSAPANGKTNAVCEVSFGAPASGICPNKINLTWNTPAGTVTSYHVYRCDATAQIAAYCDDNLNYAQAGGDCWDTTNTNCTDEVPLADKSHRFYYKVAGYNSAVPEEGDWSDKTGPDVACPKSPIWEEVKP
ncbi:hypothetical protein A3G56_01515 [Candidatus Falkowbacteria bacterium RIFCSPLOWO2_12_FULL_45_10]|uniref:Fibronectin type-III domain-containing protein n=1 Tax=Candidatus Falkowbacteria bacterium RIFCSPLOWO2_12_FULL_45_10 TaxID=1797990 RepID=A0A1F5RYA2_9BACT|nr:MAG: hypothetical protein A3G56_01515 [Candidatus Falkowbacteria bacterium RIFCSPLOWO2_12_FULL_45_10]